MTTSDTEGSDWYISGRHARRAIGYLTAALPELQAVEVPRVAEAWAEALERTIDPDERSPVGAEVMGPRSASEEDA